MITLRIPRIIMPRKRRKGLVIMLREGRLCQERKILKRRTKKRLKRVPLKILKGVEERALRGFQDIITTYLLKLKLLLMKSTSILLEFKPAAGIRITLLVNNFPKKKRRLM